MRTGKITLLWKKPLKNRMEKRAQTIFQIFISSVRFFNFAYPGNAWFCTMFQAVLSYSVLFFISGAGAFKACRCIDQMYHNELATVVDSGWGEGVRKIKRAPLACGRAPAHRKSRCFSSETVPGPFLACRKGKWLTYHSLQTKYTATVGCKQVDSGTAPFLLTPWTRCESQESHSIKTEAKWIYSPLS